MANGNDVQKKIDRWFWVTVVTGLVLPCTTFFLAVVSLHGIGLKKLTADDLNKLYQDLTFENLTQSAPFLIIILGFMASPYIYLAHKGYQWMAGLANKLDDREHINKYFTVVKWSYGGSALMGFLFYASFAFAPGDSGIGIVLVTPLPLAPPLLGAGIGFVIGWFVAGIKPDDQVPRRNTPWVG